MPEPAPAPEPTASNMFGNLEKKAMPAQVIKL